MEGKVGRESGRVGWKGSLEGRLEPEGGRAALMGRLQGEGKGESFGTDEKLSK